MPKPVARRRPFTPEEEEAFYASFVPMPVASKPEPDPNAPVYVQIIGDHPHAGCRGYVECKDGKMPRWTGNGFDPAGSYMVHLIDCRHGVGSCYAAQRNMRPDHGRS